MFFRISAAITAASECETVYTLSETDGLMGPVVHAQVGETTFADDTGAERINDPEHTKMVS